MRVKNLSGKMIIRTDSDWIELLLWKRMSSECGKELEETRSPGPGTILSWVLKKYAMEFVGLLKIICKEVTATGVVPWIGNL